MKALYRTGDWLVSRDGRMRLLRPRYLLRDEFTTALATGSVNGTAAEPGPGTRTVVDIFNLINISGGKIVLADSTGKNWGQTYIAEPPLIGRPSGTLGFFQFTPNNTSTCRTILGFGEIASNYPAHPGVYIVNGLFNVSEDDLVTMVNVGVATPGVDYTFLFSLRSTGHFFVVKGGPYTNWTYLWSTKTNTLTNAVPFVSATGLGGNLNFIRVPTTLWLPTPLLSDGFGGTWPTTDGAGHAETTDLGSGGGGLTWAAALGTWGSAGGVASSSVLDASGISIAIATLPTANVHYSCVLAYSAGSAGVIVRYVDVANYTYVVNDGTNVKLFEVTTANPYPGTQRGTAVKAPAAGARLIVDTSGAACRVYYNEVFLYAYATLANTTAVKVGMITSNVNNTFNDAVAYAKGTGGEYNFLDRYARA